MKRYGQWAGNPKGWPEDKTRCVEEVFEKFMSNQCSRLRGFGPDKNYCKQHAKRFEKTVKDA